LRLEIGNPARLSMFTDENASVDHAREGDSGAFLRLVCLLYDQRILRLARYLTESDAAAEQVVVDTFLQASGRLGQIERESNFRKVIIQIAVNQASLINNQAETRKGAPLDELIDFAERSANAVYLCEENFRERFSSGEMERILESAIRKLDLPARKAFVLREIEGLSIEDASKIAGLPVPAFKDSLLRALLRLPEHLAFQMKSKLEPRGSGEHPTNAVRGAPRAGTRGANEMENLNESD